MLPRTSRAWLWTLSSLVALLLPAACQKDSPVAPSGSSDVRLLRVLVDRTSLTPSDSTLVQAWVVSGPDPGTPVDGAAVSFSELGVAAGSFSKDESTTDLLGKAEAVYRPAAGTSGDVTLKVKAGNDVEYVALRVSSTPGDGVGLTFSTSGSQTSLPADGQSAIQVTVTARRADGVTPLQNLSLVLAAGDQFVDLNHNGLFDGTDQLVTTGDRNGNGLWDAEGALPEALITDTAGRAMFYYQAGSTVGNVWLKVTGQGVTGDLQLFQHPTTLAVSLEVGGRELLADGVSELPVTARVSDWGGASIPGIIVKFVAGEPFVDVDGDGYYTAGVDSYDDQNHNGQWDSVGSISSTTTTQANGSAVVQYVAGVTPGDVTIRATTSSGSAETLVRLVAVPPASSLSFDLDTTSLYADGSSTLSGSLSARDVNGFPLPGKRVMLVAGERFRDVDLDGAFTPGTDVLLEDANGDLSWTASGTISSPVYADAWGAASFTYQAGEEAGTVWIHATADQASTDVPIDLAALPTTLSMSITTSAMRISVFGSGGQDNTVVTAICNDAFGHPVPAGVPVLFSLENGPGGGERLEGAEAGVFSARTNGSGEATAILVAGTRPGQIEVQATSGATMRSARVYVGAGPAASISLHPEQNQVEFWSTLLIEAYVQDAYGNPVEDGTVVRFTADEGVMIGESGPGYSETVNGTTSATYQSLGPAAATDFIAEISAEVENTVAGATTNVQLGQGEALQITSFDIESNRSEINVRGVGGVEEALVRARGLDGAGRPVGAGYAVSFSIASGPGAGESLNNSGDGPVSVLTGSDGWAEARLRSGSAPGAVEVQASAATATPRSIFLAIASGGVATMECYADSSRLAENGESDIHVYLYDAAHNPVPDGTVVYFTVDEGIIQGTEGQGSALSSGGIALARYHATLGDVSSDGLAEILCEAANGMACTVTIAVPRAPNSAVRLTLDADLAEIGVRGTGAAEQARLRARAFDAYDNPLRAGTPITFTITQGPDGGEKFLSGTGPATVDTDPTGTAEVILLSGTVSGTVVVTATAGTNTTNHTSVAIAAGPPHYLYLGAEACNVLGANRTNVENDLVALVSDVYRNPVRDNTVIYWTTDKGVVEGGTGLGSSATIRGLADATWRSGDSEGYVTISASTLGGTLLTTTTFISSDDPVDATVVTPSSDLVSLPADGVSEMTVMVDVRDAYGNFTLPADVDYQTDFGTVVGQEASADGCHASIAKAKYRSATLDRDYSYSVPDDGVGAVDDVLVGTGYGGFTDEFQVELATSAASKDNSELEIESSVAAGGSLIFSVTIADRYGNPLGGHALSITTSGGTITGSATTDLWGVADGLVFTAPGSPGSVTITIVDVDPSYSGGLVLGGTVTVQ